MMSRPVTRDDLVAALVAAVPPGRLKLTTAEIAALQQSTAALLNLSGDDDLDEFRRFESTRDRHLDINESLLGARHRDRTILVTGGTGCIGSNLLAELTEFGPARLVSVARGRTAPWAVYEGVEYLRADIRDRPAINDIITRLQPDIVYHLAAQHNPALAEVEVARTLSTNITGSVNVFDACRAAGSAVVHASTGKALRPYTPDVYAGSKKVAEWLLGQSVSTNELMGAAARFTHVVDNSIIAARLRDWAADSRPIRLHSTDISFYLQSAREGAQLLLSVGLESVLGELRLGAIRDLGWPISLLDLALGWLNTREQPSPVYVCGFEAGYEDNPYPALYDPRFSGGRSPLFSALEAPSVVGAQYCHDIDVFTVRPSSTRTAGAVADLVADLEHAALVDAPPHLLRAKLSECGWAMLAASLDSVSTAVLNRHLEFVRSMPPNRFSSDDSAVVAIMKAEITRRYRPPRPQRTADAPSGPATVPSVALLTSVSHPGSMASTTQLAFE